MTPGNDLMRRMVGLAVTTCASLILAACAPPGTSGTISTATPVPQYYLDSSYSGAVWYKGQLHAHSTRSDGSESPSAMLHFYQDRGYQFIALTDHDIACSDIYADPGVPGIRYIPSEEDGLYLETHLLAIGLTRHESPCGPKEDWSMQHRINYVTDQGGIAVLAHPFWKNGSWGPLLEKDLCALGGYIGLEIANHDDQFGGNAQAIALWDELLAADRRVWGFAVDDAHSFDPGGINRGWIMVNSLRYADVPVDSANLAHQVPDQQDILDSIKQGRFLAWTRTVAENPGAAADDATPLVTIGTAGPRVIVSTDQIAVNQGDAILRFIGRGGRVLAEYPGPTTGNYLVGGYYDSDGSEGYVRVELVIKKAAATYVIYSQPIFVADADPANQGVEGIVHQRLSVTGLTFTRREPSCGFAPVVEQITGDGRFHMSIPAGSYDYVAADGYYEARGQVTIPLEGFVDLDIRLEPKPGPGQPP